MASPVAERAIEEALRCGRAVLKFVSANDVGRTGGHQCGFYLPKNAWKLYAPEAPRQGWNYEVPTEITWQDGSKTDSRVKWYGVGSRSEFRLTRFGKDFPFLTDDNVGDLLVVIPWEVGKRQSRFSGYVLDLEDDIEEVQASLGVSLLGTVGIFEGEPTARLEKEDDCIVRHFREFTGRQSSFPTGAEFSRETQAVLDACIAQFGSKDSDTRLVRLIREEYLLFRMVERLLCQPEINRLFKSVDDFIQTANSILNRRKARAGRSLENHVEYLLSGAGLQFDVRPNIDGKPDIVFPGKVQYDDPSFPADSLIIVGVKTTCKDRWRQVLNEAKRAPKKHILTLQEGISRNQLKEMAAANITLIVPRQLQRSYPPDAAIEILTVEQFVANVRAASLGV